MRLVSTEPPTIGLASDVTAPCDGQCSSQQRREHTPIDGLFAVGNVSGCFYGGVDYPMDVLGLSIGRAITGGYLAGKHVAAL